MSFFVQCNIKYCTAIFANLPFHSGNTLVKSQFMAKPSSVKLRSNVLTHWGRATHICVGNLITIGSDNGLSPGRRQAIIWTNAGILSIGPLGTNFSEILIGIQTFSFKKMHLKMSSAKWRPFVSASMSWARFCFCGSCSSLNIKMVSRGFLWAFLGM